MRRFGIAALIAIAGNPVWANDNAIGGSISTLGAGVEYTRRLDEQFNLRVNANGLNYNRSDTIDDIHYDAKLRLRNAGVLADWVVNRWLRLSAGLYYNGNKADLSGNPTDGNYTFNGASYPAAAVGDLSGKVDFNTFSPYLGIGFGNPVGSDSNWTFTFDVGVLFQGSPKVSLNAQCSPLLSAADCQVLQDNVTAEEDEVRKAAEDYEFWPVVKLGLHYAF
ncbi:hypothetical protein [Chitinolyticbacter meiyuanensis]|uniref:hypothetical protein n=1 Tax=Chitinolyticbacter meiyuanensis TaxID=682798 RepID=UPI0011E5E4EC|nr:hypothetical protein [Chitinolyticbacter meiyuanensis]